MSNIILKEINNGNKKIDGWWVDKNGNMWLGIKYTQQEALEYSKSLVNCKYCIDCINCEGCVDCVRCKYCKECKRCENSHHCECCEDCEHCDQCYICKECHGCKHYKNSFKIQIPIGS